MVLQMDDEKEPWNTANEHLRLYGSDAAIMAAQKADQPFEDVALDEAHRWRIVVRRINILLERPYGPLH
jgi:hypothetical protein